MQNWNIERKKNLIIKNMYKFARAKHAVLRKKMNQGDKHILTNVNEEISRNFLNLKVEVADEVQEQVGIFDQPLVTTEKGKLFTQLY